MKPVKYLLITACMLVFAISAHAQGPQLINYQAIARDASGNIIVSQPVGVQLTITDGSPTGTTQYQETHSVTTNAFGLFSLQVGGGTVVSGTMSGVTWSSGTKYLLVGIDPTGGASYTPMGSQQLVSVPYSLYTNNATNATNLTGTVTMAGDVTGTNSAAAVVKIQGNPVSATAPAAGQVLSFTTGAWTPTTIPGATAYTAGTGMTLTGTTFSAENTTALWNANELQGNAVSATVPATGQVLSYTAGLWTPTTIPGATAYTAGTGMTLTGTTFSAENTTALWNADELQGNPVSATAPASGQVLSYTAGAWTPTTIPGATAYTAGTGMILTGTTFNAKDTAAIWNANELQGKPVSATAPATGQVLEWTTGGTWAPITPAAAAGWNLTGNTGTTPATNFVGTTDGNALRFGVNSTWAGELNPTTFDASYGVNAGKSVTSGINNVAIGPNALYSNVAGNGFVAIGDSALFSQNGGLGGNVAIGNKALLFNTTGYNNTATGAQTLDSNTTGYENTAMGCFSLHDNTTGYSNTAAGRNSLTYNTTGYQNAASGVGSSAANTTGNGNTSAGFQGLYSNTTGNSNVAIGIHALYSDTSGSNQVAIGDSALYSQQGGLGQNVAIGSKALYTNTTGYENTATGYQSLNANTVGYQNDANGYLSLTANTLGYENTATGSQSLFSNTTGYQNTANGYQSLYYNIGGYFNTASGYQSLASNTSGNFNTASGFQSLHSNTIGYSNTAAGRNSLGNNTTGYQNEAFGTGSSAGNTTGNGNTTMGFQSFYTNTLGSSNVAIGIQALYSNGGNSNQVAIGDSALYNNNLGLGQNVAIGSKALYTATTGYQNTATGFQSLYTNTSGYENTAYGYQSLYGNTSGYENTAVGWSAYPSSATLFNWTAIGYNAGGSYSTSNSVELGNTSVLTIRAQVTGITAISDGRIKDNVQANVPGLDFITRLRPVTYNLNIHRQNAMIYKDKKGADKEWDGKYDIEKKTMSGFIAQEVDQAAKAAGYDFCGVEHPATPDGLYGIRYTDFIMPLVKSVQELNTANEAQKKSIESQGQTITELQNQIAELLKRVQDLETKK